MSASVRIILWWSAVLACLIGTGSVSAATYYVDTVIAADCANYETASRSCAGGDTSAFISLDQAMSVLRPGDTLLLRAGDYSQLSVQQSGRKGEPITISAFPGETARISDVQKVALWVVEKSDLIIRDLSVNSVMGFGRLEEAQRVHIDNIKFKEADASGTTGALKFVRSSHNRVTNSSFDEGSDLLLLQDSSNQNIIQDNEFGDAGHSLISIRCSSQNVIRGNRFDNPSQKAVEIYDCEGVSDAPVRLDDTKHNLLEQNVFLGTKPSSRAHNYNAIQHGGQNTIVRMNVFASNAGGGVNYQYYRQESVFVYGNRLYNNTFHNNRCFAISGQPGTRKRYYDNAAVNNLLYANTNCEGRGEQIRVRDRRALKLSNNIEVLDNPGLVDPKHGIFRLESTSSLIDAGKYVAESTSPGSGNRMQVDDANWFFDGFGIEGEKGDLVRVEGVDTAVRIVAVDYENNYLAFDKEVSWSKKAGVHLDFSGKAPDIGAFEFDPVAE